MASPSPGEFMTPNSERLQRQHQSIVKLRPGVVRRNHAEPDRTHVEGAKALNPQPVPEPEAAPEVAAKKKRRRAKVTADTRAVAVSRVEKLIAAGNPAAEAHESVAKELGVSVSAIQNWRTIARKAPKPRAGKVARRASNNGAHGYAPNTPMPLATVGEKFLELIGDSIGPLVRQVVREELRKLVTGP